MPSTGRGSIASTASENSLASVPVVVFSAPFLILPAVLFRFFLNGALLFSSYGLVYVALDVIALLGFVSTVALARFIARGDIVE